MVPINIDTGDAQSLSCRLGKFPLKYPGVPCIIGRLEKKKICNQLLIKMIKRLAGWRGKLPSQTCPYSKLSSQYSHLPAECN
jgi:hypothetical protein